jgi:putative ABC transport system substrate-binding protein
MAKARAGALTVLADPMFISEQKQIANLALRSRLPSAFARRENVEAGGLMSYGPNLADLFRQAATYVSKVLRGAKPADLPVEQASKYELVINFKTAKALVLKIPQSMFIRADEVIQ